MTSFPLRPGMSGDAVADLQRRLHGTLGPLEGMGPGDFDDATEAAVTAFQTDRGLDRTGIVDEQTWLALVESGYRLGDRPLYRHVPMLRGDDVEDLQRRLGALGFDAGWLDGIFGPDTEQAVKEFQRNAGLMNDGIAGTATIDVLTRMSARSLDQEPVLAVREREARRSARGLRDRRVAIGDHGDLGALVDAAARALRQAGANVVALHHPDPAEHAAMANSFDAHVYFGLSMGTDPGVTAYYFATDGFVSEGGRALAESAAVRVGALLGVDAEHEGVRRPVLRQTRMPAVECRVGPPSTVVAATGRLSSVLADLVVSWCHADVDAV